MKKITYKTYENAKGPNRIRTDDLAICSRPLYSWATDPDKSTIIYRSLVDWFQINEYVDPLNGFSMITWSSGLRRLVETVIRKNVSSNLTLVNVLYILDDYNNISWLINQKY